MGRVISRSTASPISGGPRVFTTFEGDNTILLQLVAKSLLSGYRDQFGELNPLETAGFFAAVALQTVVERSAAAGTRPAADRRPGSEPRARRGPRRPRLSPEPVPLAGGARPLGSGAPTEAGDQLRNPAVRGLQRLSGPRPRDRPRARAARAARRVLRSRDRRVRGRPTTRGARAALRPLRAGGDRARPGLVPRSTDASPRPGPRPSPAR